MQKIGSFMKNVSKYLLLFLAGPLLIAQGAIAGGPPALFTSCGDKIKIKAPKTGAGVYFSADCKTAYVLPPAKGELFVSEASETGNAMMCTTYENSFKIAEMKSNLVKRLLSRIEAKDQSVKFDLSDDPWIYSEPKDETNLNPDLEELSKLQDQVITESEKIGKHNEFLAGFEGPKVKLTVISDHNSLVQAYQELNDGIGIDFRPIPLTKSALTYIPNSDKNIGRAKAVLDWQVPGIHISHEYFTGKELLDAEAAKSNPTILFTSAASGRLTMSLIGGCPLYNPGTREFDVKKSKLSQHFVVSSNYAYNVAVNRRYKAEYNVWELFKRLQKKKKSGGLFSSKTVHSLIIERDSSGWFKFKSLSEDNNHEFNQQIAQTVKAEVIGRLLQRMGAKPVGTPEAPPDLIAPGPSGASTIATGLATCPHIYCQGAAFVLTGLDAIFGSSTATSEFISKTNYWEIEEVDQTKMVPRFGQVAFPD
jgi:hypothetical protein